MVIRPVTTVEVLLQQIGDSLVEITGLLRQATATPPTSEPEPEPEPTPVVVTEPDPKPKTTRPAKPRATPSTPKTKE
jgi:hypothetical protein